MLEKAVVSWMQNLGWRLEPALATWTIRRKRGGLRIMVGRVHRLDDGFLLLRVPDLSGYRSLESVARKAQLDVRWDGTC